MVNQSECLIPATKMMMGAHLSLFRYGLRLLLLTLNIIFERFRKWFMLVGLLSIWDGPMVCLKIFGSKVRKKFRKLAFRFCCQICLAVPGQEGQA
jgi:hypothetical protein